jgi:putative cell wall-binding protein
MTSKTAILTLPRKIAMLLLGVTMAAVIAAFAPSTAQAAENYYDIWVGDVQVSDSNANNVLAASHNGSAGKVKLVVVDSYMDHYALYLDNANIKVAEIASSPSDDAAGIYVGSEVNCLDIYLTGKNTISMPSGNLEVNCIKGVCSYGEILHGTSISISSNAPGASLSMELSGVSEYVHGIYNSGYGVDINDVNLSIAVKSTERDAYGIAACDSRNSDEVNINKSTVNIDAAGKNDTCGIRVNNNALCLSDSAVTITLDQQTLCYGDSYGINLDGGLLDVDNASTLIVNGGGSLANSAGIKDAKVWVSDGSQVHAYAAEAGEEDGYVSAGLSGDRQLVVNNGGAAEFSGQTCAIENSVDIYPTTIELGAIVNTEPSFQGGFSWDGSTSLDTYKYVHFPGPIDIAEAVIGAIANQKYTGKIITPAITVIFGNTVLSAATDYAVSYSNNVKPGKATVTVTGKGIFGGTKTAVFTISHTVKWNRIYGQTAPETMKKIAAVFGKTRSAVVTTDASYKDALAASALAGKCNGLVLMTKKGSLTAQTKTALKTAGVKTVYIVGSTANVSAAVEKQLKSGTGVTKVVRISGTTPSQRAVASAKYGGKKSDTAIIATQNGFQDALSIAPYSYATKSPILYAEGNKKLSAATVSYIKSAKYKKAIVIGGPIALPASIDNQLKGAGVTSITRLAGANAYRTSELIANWTMGKLANGNHDKYKGKAITYVKFQPTVKMKADKLAVSTGQNWLDALSGAALCGKNRSVMLLADTKGGNHCANAVNFLKSYKLTMNSAFIFGGTSAVSVATANALAAATK